MSRRRSRWSPASILLAYHAAMAVTWLIYSAVWALSYVLPLPEALFTVKALIGVSLLTALESSAGALHALQAREEAR